MRRKMGHASSMTADTLKAVIEGAISPKEIEWDASCCNLGLVKPSVLIEAIQFVPSHIKKINLCGNNLNSLTADSFIQLLNALPNSVESIVLSGNFLCKMKSENLAQVLSSLKPSIKIINLSLNYFNQDNASTHIFAHLPDSIHTAELGFNFGNNATDLYKILPTLNEVVLSRKAIDKTNTDTAKDLVTLHYSFFQPTTLSINSKLDTFLILGRQIWYLTIQLISYHKNSNEVLTQKLNPLIETLKQVNLPFYELPTQERLSFLKLFPQAIQSIIINKHLYLNTPYKIYCEETAKRLVEDVKKIINQSSINPYNFETIVPISELNELHLQGVITYLEQEKSAINYFTCALLLEGIIANYHNIDEYLYEDYIEKRTHTAISYYLKASNDMTIRPFASLYLWEMKACYLKPSIQIRLSYLMLIPVKSVTPSFIAQFTSQPFQLFLPKSLSFFYHKNGSGNNRDSSNTITNSVYLDGNNKLL